MQKGAWLINGSRGGLVDEEALYWALKDGYLSGAALDVFANEPYTGPLCELDNVILTPHIGSYAIESRIEMELQAVRNVIKGLKKQ
jgi:D-3-phosphoglycerate dehydrogenase